MELPTGTVGELINKQTDYKLLPYVNERALLPFDNGISVNDLDVDVTTLGAGMTMISAVLVSNPVNAPFGTWIHVQRLSHDCSEQQYVFQFNITNGKLYFRSGKGNGEGVTWNDLRII